MKNNMLKKMTIMYILASLMLAATSPIYCAETGEKAPDYANLQLAFEEWIAATKKTAKNVKRQLAFELWLATIDAQSTPTQQEVDDAVIISLEHQEWLATYSEKNRLFEETSTPAKIELEYQQWMTQLELECDQWLLKVELQYLEYDEFHKKFHSITTALKKNSKNPFLSQAQISNEKNRSQSDSNSDLDSDSGAPAPKKRRPNEPKKYKMEKIS